MGSGPFLLMRRNEHVRDCNHFYIIPGQCHIIRKSRFPRPQKGLKLQALFHPGLWKVTEIALASFCPCVHLCIIASVRWQFSRRSTLLHIYQHFDEELLCGASCFQNQLPKLHLNPFSMQHDGNLYCHNLMWPRQVKNPLEDADV